MKALRNFEALFLTVLGLACATNYALDSTGAERPVPALQAVQAAATPAMPVVVVSAKRLSAAEKQASLAAERKATPAGKI